MADSSYVDAIHATLAEEMRANPRICVLAPPAANRDGAAWLSPSLMREFGAERVRLAAVTEATLAGLARGAANGGAHPVLVLPDTPALMRAAEHLALHAAAAQYRAAGSARASATTGSMPLLLRAAGQSHLEAWFTHVPGLLVIAPATPYDARGLLRSALRAETPVLCLEDERLYQTRGDIPDGDYTVPLGAAVVRRPGKEVTVVSYGCLAQVALAACQQAAVEQRIDAEMIDLRTLQPLDLPLVLESLRKTGRVLLCSEAAATGNCLCELAQRISEHGFDDLDAPVRRLCALDVPLHKHPALAAQASPSQAQIARAIADLARE